MSKHAITLSQAIDGYLLAARARRLSQETVEHYTVVYRRFQQHLATDPPLDDILPDHVRAFLAAQTQLCAKSILNYRTALAALWTWSVREGIATRHVVRDVAAPRPAQRVIQPYTKAEIQALLHACDRSRPYSRPGKRPCDNERPTALRDRAIILTLLDTGIRASELCGLHISDVNLKMQQILVFGKGSRERIVPFSARTAQAVWRYLATRPAAAPADVLFPDQAGSPYDRRALRRQLSRLGQKAGVPGVDCHRFRHTFAIMSLRNGMNIFALQRILGHSTLDMVRRYLAIVQTDLDQAHRDASPVANWVL